MENQEEQKIDVMMPSTSDQPRFDKPIPAESDIDSAFFRLARWANERGDDLPRWGSFGRNAKLREVWRDEPILAGAITSLRDRFAALNWSLMGPREMVEFYHPVLAEAEDGRGWGNLVSKSILDYLATDIGVCWEFGRLNRYAPVSDIFYLDSTRCLQTQNRRWPLAYKPGNPPHADPIIFPYEDCANIPPSPIGDEVHMDLGFCFVSRAFEAAKILLLMHDYERERLGDLPPAAVGTLNGMTPEQFASAVEAYKQRNIAEGNFVWRDVLFLVGSPGPKELVTPIDLKLIPFSTLPESFDRKDVVETYVKILALNAGVDVGEFWLVQHSGATKALGTIQHLKSKGKGIAVLITEIEYVLSRWVLPEQLSFKFDAQDDEEDMLRAEVKEKQIANVRSLVAPIDPVQGGESLIPAEDARRLLRRWGIIPENLTAQDELQIEAWNRAKMLGEPVVVMDRNRKILAYETPYHHVPEMPTQYKTVGDDYVYPKGEPIVNGEDGLDQGSLEEINVDDLLASVFEEVGG